MLYNTLMEARAKPYRKKKKKKELQIKTIKIFRKLLSNNIVGSIR